MSAFSEKLRTAIEECGVSVGDLAEQSGISASMLYKIQSGARLVDSLETLNRLLDAMICSLPLRTELLQSYKIERIGVNRFACFQELKGLISDIGVLSPNIRELVAYENLNIPSTISGSRNVNAAVVTLINREALRDGGHIEMMIPVSYSYGLECISQALSGCVSGFRGICHLFCLKSSGSDEALLYNMTAIRSLIPRMLNLDRYDLRYSYVPEPDDGTVLFPYFIITSDSVLLLDGLLNHAVFLHEPAIRAVYEQTFAYMALNFVPVMRTGEGTVLNYFNAHQKIVGRMKKHPSPVCIAAQPCILPCLSPASAMKYLPPKAAKNQEITEGIAAFFQNSAVHGYTTFFSIEGLHLLIETGEIMEMVGPRVPRLRRDDVLDSLEELIRRAKRGNVIPCLFRQDLFRGISRISFGLYGTTLFVGCEIPSRQMIFTDITEATLAKVIKDYANYALQLGDVISPEETIRILEHEVRRFRKEAT